MQSFEYTLCSGSGNRFLMLDTLRTELTGLDLAGFIRSELPRYRVDGLLLLVRDDSGILGMRMFNTDGSEAEMCGNGIRCVARLAHDRYPQLTGDRFLLTSGGKEYPIVRAEPITGSLPTYGVEIPLATASDDFLAPPTECGTAFVGEPLAELSERLAFTFLQPGNPHIVACTAARDGWLFDGMGRLDTNRLAMLGERASRMHERFPRGVNVSLFCRLDEQRIFVATYERGVGLTSSCGTAMTSCATAAALLGICDFDREIEVCNRGGKVRCLPRRTERGLVTRLTGNASFERTGMFRIDDTGRLVEEASRPFDAPEEERRLAATTRNELKEQYGLSLEE